ncbi:hypothetical protein EUX98_g838 [Antrodiella citrinella]|uniref:Uncharacterized protein n=1 Tax=Antrodiella citrinella TaxID=2447956 RepID=A0A4S4N311_9APHY|nr:hypothetical protein EUX98_g838 [Antrodiella citrinella]
MPRGIPNARRDETAMRFTSFHVPLASVLLFKHLGVNHFIESYWYRTAARGSAASKGKGAAEDSTTAEFDVKVAAISISLRDRMRFYKLRVTTNAASIASTFNDQFKPEIIPEANDPYHVDWITESDEDTLVGEAVLRLSNPQSLNYLVRWPFYRGSFNTRVYSSNQLIVSDVEAILENVLRERLGIEKHSYHEYSVVIVIPDFYDRFYVDMLVSTLMESLAATYGAGISNACVVDMGATKTSIACVDDGLVIAETRMTLNMGGDDITEFLYVLLEKISFPYRDADLARSYDWNVMEDLKARLCTLAEGDVALNLYDFVVRRPGKATEKYGLRAYDEIILSPMCLFEPRVIEFDNKRVGMRSVAGPGVVPDVIDQPTDHVTNAMMISTQHLLPTAPMHAIIPAELPLSLPASGSQTPGVVIVAAQPHDLGDASGALNLVPTPTDTPVEGPKITPEETKPEGSTTSRTSVPPSAPGTSANATGKGTADAPMEISDTEGPETRPLPVIPQEQLHAHYSAQHQPSFPGGFAIDVCFEASKLPLDVAIFNSARAAGGDEKIRKYLQAVLVIGGTALVPGMAHALESRLQAIATPLVPNMEKVQLIPPPKDVDPRILAWKGAAVLARMDGISDMWVTKQDWDMFGMKAVKERCYFI